MKPNLLRIEAIKLRRRSAFTLAVFIFVVFLMLMLAGFAYAISRGRLDIKLPGFWNESHSMAAQMGVFFSWITVVNLVAAEYAWRTSRQNVIDGLSRDQWFLAKLMLVPLISLLFWAIFWGLMIPFGAIVAETREPFMSAGQPQAILALLLSAIGFSSFALFASFLTRNTAGGIALVFGWMTIGEGIIQLMLFRAGREYLKYATFLPTKAFGEIGQLYRWVPTTMPRGMEGPTFSTGTILTTALLYIVLFTAASWALVRRQDL